MVCDPTDSPGFWESLMESVDGEGDPEWRWHLAAAVGIVAAAVVMVAMVKGAVVWAKL